MTEFLEDVIMKSEKDRLFFYWKIDKELFAEYE